MQPVQYFAPVQSGMGLEAISIMRWLWLFWLRPQAQFLCTMHVYASILKCMHVWFRMRKHPSLCSLGQDTSASLKLRHFFSASLSNSILLYRQTNNWIWTLGRIKQPNYFITHSTTICVMANNFLTLIPSRPLFLPFVASHSRPQGSHTNGQRPAKEQLNNNPKTEIRKPKNRKLSSVSHKKKEERNKMKKTKIFYGPFVHSYRE